MQYKGGSILKNLRKQMNISQDEMAKRLYMNPRQLSRVENGEAELDWQAFITAFSVLGRTSDDFWIMYLDYDEFVGYTQYQEIGKHFRNGRLDEARKVFASFKGSPLTKHGFMTQFVLAAGLILNEGDDGAKKEGLYDALSMSINRFDISKINGYSLSYNEVLIINELALTHSRLGDCETAIALLLGVAGCVKENRLRMTPVKKRLLFPAPIVNLYRLLVQAGRYAEAAAMCEMAMKEGAEAQNYYYYPETVYTMAICDKYMQKPPDEYKPLLVRAYHAACGIGQNELAKRIKEAYHETDGR